MIKQIQSIIINKDLTKNIFSLILLFSIIGVIIYYPALNARLFFDDEYFILRNNHVHNFNIIKIISTGDSAGSGHASTFYRPLQFIVYSFIWQFFKSGPLFYHLTSLFFHILSCFLLFFLLLDFKISKKISFFSSLFFLVHPVNTQAISYVSGLGDVLGLFFILLSLIIYRKDEFFKNKISQYLLFGFFIILSFLSKERSLMFLIILIITSFSFPKSKKTIQNNQDKEINLKKIFKTDFLFYIISFLLTLLYFLYRIFNSSLSLTSSNNIYTSNILIRGYTFLYEFTNYILIIFFPKTLYSERPFLIIETLFNFKVIFSLILLLFLTFFSLYLLIKRNHAILLFSFFWFMFFLAPTSGVIVMSYTIKEHWIYYSMIGFSLAFTYYFFKFFNKINKKKLAIILFILIILLLSVRTYNRNLDWSSPQRFFQTELRYNSESENALANLAYEYYLNGDYIRASELYKKGIEVTNSNQLAMMYYNLGYMYFLIDNNYSRAIPLYEKSLEIDPYYIYALQELSNYYYNLNNTKEFNKYYFKLENLIKNTIDY